MKFNGIDPCSLHRGISIEKEIPPGTVASQLETLSGATGELIVGRTIKQDEYIVRINIAGKYRAEAWEIRKILAAWARGMDKQTCELIPTHWPDVHYDAILKEISPPEYIFSFGKIEVSFALPRPIAIGNTWRSSSGSGIVADQFHTVYGETFKTANGEQLYVIPDAIMPADDSGINTPIIDGSSYARPRFMITCIGGEGVNLYVDGSRLLSLTGAFGSGEIVEVSTIIPRIRVRSVSGIWTNADERADFTITDFQALAEAFAPGAHTVYCPESSGINVSWRDEWM